MNEERDPLLQEMFSESFEELNDDNFAAELMAKIEHESRRKKRSLYVLVGALLIVALPISLYATNVLLTIPSLAAVEIINTKGNAWGSVLTPINSFALPLFIGFKLFQLLMRKVRGA